MEVRWRVVVVEHRYDNSQESTYLGQGIAPCVCSLTIWRSATGAEGERQLQRRVRLLLGRHRGSFFSGPPGFANSG
jgi:hypothetical protein